MIQPSKLEDLPGETFRDLATYRVDHMGTDNESISLVSRSNMNKNDEKVSLWVALPRWACFCNRGLQTRLFGVFKNHPDNSNQSWKWSIGLIPRWRYQIGDSLYRFNVKW